MAAQDWFAKNAPPPGQTTQPDDPNAVAYAQVQDRWGRSPGSPNYGRPPAPGEQVPIPGGGGTGNLPLGTGAESGSKPDVKAFIAQWQQTHPPDINALLAALKQAGYQNVDHYMYGSTPSGNELNINGEKFKVVAGENSGSPSWYTPGTVDSGGGGGGGALSDYGPLLQPFTGQFTAPTGTDDPGFEFALQKGQQAIQRSAAAKGTLLTGGTLRDLADYTTGAALQDYSGAYNRAKTTFDTNYGIFRNNQNDPYNKLAGVAQLGYGAVGASNNPAYTGHAIDLTTGQGNVNAGSAIGQANAWSAVPGQLANLTNSYINRPRQL